MVENRPPRVLPWKIGSFTKNFSWGKSEPGLKRLHEALNRGFDGKLKPVERRIFWDRLQRHGFVPHIVCNYFVTNSIHNKRNFIFPDELSYQAIGFEHNTDFDRLSGFNLALSEVGRWKGAKQGQNQPSEWMRFLVLDRSWSEYLRNGRTPTPDDIENFLQENRRYQGGSGTRKLATNLSFFIRKSGLIEEAIPPSEWFPKAIFLSLDRYYYIERPEKITIEWGIDSIKKHNVLDLSEGFESFFNEYGSVTTQLFIEATGPQRFENFHSESLIGVLNREPLLYKTLPDVIGEWLKKRFFIDIRKIEEIEILSKFNTEEVYEEAVRKIHNKIPRPSISGDEVISLFRTSNDDN